MRRFAFDDGRIRASDSPPENIAFGRVDRCGESSFGEAMSKDTQLDSANIKRLGDAEANRDALWEAAKRFIVEIRQQMPAKGAGTAAKRFPSIAAIRDALNFHGFKTTRGGPITYNTVNRMLADHFDEWTSIPSAQVIENALLPPPIHIMGRFRLLEDVGEFVAGDYGQVNEINEHGVIGFFTDWDSARIAHPEHMEILVRPHQMRMVATDLMDWFSLKRDGSARPS